MVEGGGVAPRRLRHRPPRRVPGRDPPHQNPSLLHRHWRFRFSSSSRSSTRLSSPANRSVSETLSGGRLFFAHSASDGWRRIVATPYAKKFAKDLKLDLTGSSVPGPMGRIVAKDVEIAAASAAAMPIAPPKATVESGSARSPTSPAIELGTVVPFITIQGAVSKNMAESLSVPTFQVGYTITTNALSHLYKKVGIFSISNFLKKRFLIELLLISQSCFRFDRCRLSQRVSP
ncbi:hypothetical protein B296_00054775 [Ensete ventricosum]|uniref:Peripheral subunit-binding (PSBD) domain-containing protein n=1 Tax=Ensete ventricosum TaxID=4639 RepID=A0A426X325_ENSVE|nr:hypothetical protein B296_00054775 [Ensete ventricosum]